MSEAEESSAKAGGKAPQHHLTLQVPPSVDLQKLSNQEIEKLAIDLSHKAASAIGKGGAILGVGGVSLVGNTQAQARSAISVTWRRFCRSADLREQGVEIDPSAFVSHPGTDLGEGESVKTVIERSTQKRP